MASKDLAGIDDSGGQLMKDFNELRRRLVLTEESLRSLGSHSDTSGNSTGMLRPSYERPHSESGFILQPMTPSKVRLKLDDKVLNSSSRTTSLPAIDLSAKESSYRVNQINEKISYMAQIIKEKDIQIRDLHRVINEKDTAIEKLNSEISMADEDLRRESKLRKSIEEKLKDSLYAGEELKEKVIDLKNHIHLEKETNSTEMEHLKLALEELEAERYMLKERDEQLKKSLRFNESLRDENQSLHSELESKDGLITEVQAKLASMEELRTANEELRRENGRLCNGIDSLKMNLEETILENQDLKAGKEDMEGTIHMYEEDLEYAKEKIAELENRKIIFSSKKSGNSASKSDALCNENPIDGQSKISLAESELKLALKDAEIHKLQAALLSKAATSLKTSSVVNGNHESEAQGLRSEFAAFLERNKLGDRKQQDLERIISHLEDEVAKNSDEIMILEERLTDKLSYISLLEGKLEQKNSKMTFMQEEMNKLSEIKSELEKKLQSKDLHVQKAEQDLQSCNEKLSEYTKQIEGFEWKIGEKIKNIAYLEDVIKMKDSEAKQTKNLIEKIKNLNSEHCQELQLQIDSLQEQVDVRNLELTNSQATLTALQQELDLKTSVCLDLEAKLNETTAQLEERAIVLSANEDNLKKLSAQLQGETQNVEHLQRALSDCREELKMLIEQAEKDRHDLTDDASKQRKQFEQLKKEHDCNLEVIECRTNELNEALNREKGNAEQIKSLTERTEGLERMKAEIEEDNEKITKEYEHERESFEKTMNEVKMRIGEMINELDTKSKENSQLKITLEEIQMKSVLDMEKREELEKLINKLNEEKHSQETLTKSYQSEAKEKESSNKTLLKKFQELKRKCANEESLHQKASSKIEELEKELATVHTELRQTVDDLSRLQIVLEENEKEIQIKEETISVMDRKLNESQENIQFKDALLKEQSAKLSLMDKSMKEHQLELKQKAVEVTQLDMSMKEQQSQLQHRLNTAEEQLRNTTQELSDSLSQIAELQAKIELTEEKLEARNDQIHKFQQTVQQQMAKLKEQSTAEAEKQKEINSLTSQVDILRHTEQELHSAKGEIQHLLVDLRQLQSELSRKHQMEEELTRELEDCHLLLQSKEADCTRLAKNLGASQVREAELEAKCMHEMQKLKKNLEFKNQRQQQEAEKASSDLSRNLAEKEKQIVGFQARIQHVVDENKLLKNDLERFRKRTSEQDREIKTLSNQLQQQQQYTDDLKENSLIRDAEFARLEARLSGYQRSAYGHYNSKLNSSFN